MIIFIGQTMDLTRGLEYTTQILAFEDSMQPQVRWTSHHSFNHPSLSIFIPQSHGWLKLQPPPSLPLNIFL